MCTVTFIPKGSGCIVAMNRDDLRTRPQALPPEVRNTGPVHSVYPMEPGGGTWCGVNEHGLIFTLLNWHVGKGEKQRTRGDVIPRVLAVSTLDAAESSLNGKTLLGMLPFRLIGFSLKEKAVCEWRWSGASIARTSHPWDLGHWFSSGMSDEQAELARRPICDLAKLQASAASVAWVRRLHRSHKPQRGAFSICVHRSDAATLSYTEITCTRTSATVRYVPGNPCERQVSIFTKLHIRT